MYDEKITRWIEDHRQEIIDKWMALIRIPSVRGEKQENAPYGAQCDRALSLAASWYENATVNHKDGYAYADYGTGEKLIGIFGHSDVVPVGEGWLYTQPFEPVIKEGTLIGRGSTDNKNGVLATWCVLQMLKDLQIPTKHRIRAFIGSNEESGMGDIEGYVRNEQMPDLSIVPDNAFPCSVGEKGILRMWAKSRETLKEVVQFQGGSAFNSVLDKVTVMLSSGEGFETVGVAKHAGSPDGSVNAAYLAAQKLLNTEDRALMAAACKVLESPYGEGLGIVHTDEEFGRTTAANGMVKIEDGHLCISLDIRYGASFDPKDLEEKLAAGWDALGFDIVEMNNRPGFSVSASPVPAIFKKLFEEATGTEKDNYRMAGGTYSRYLKNSFTTGTILPGYPRMEFPAGHGGAHGKDEAASVEGFLQGVKLLTKYVLACDNLEN